MYKVIRTCYGCEKPKRHPGCHATCPDYLRENAEHQERKKLVGREKRLYYSLEEFGIISCEKQKRRHGGVKKTRR